MRQEWQQPDALRFIWNVIAADGPPYPYYQPRGNTVQEVSYKGYRIVAQTYDGAFDKSDTMGFDVPVVFSVLDDFDEPALPLTHHWFWSPWDARAAIDFYEWVKTTIDKKNWPTTPAYEFNIMLGYRRKMPSVFSALHDIRKIIREAQDFGDDPSQAIIDRLNLLAIETR